MVSQSERINNFIVSMAPPSTMLMDYSFNEEDFSIVVQGYECSNFLEFDEIYSTFRTTYLMPNFPSVDRKSVV